MAQPKLVSLDSPDTELLLQKPILLFGRHPDCDVQLDGRKVSRRHCVVALVGPRLMVRDLDSTNGTRVNGRRVAEGPLQPGDVLAVGGFRFRLEEEDAPKDDQPGLSLWRAAVSTRGS